MKKKRIEGFYNFEIEKKKAEKQHFFTHGIGGKE